MAASIRHGELAFHLPEKDRKGELDADPQGRVIQVVQGPGHDGRGVPPGLAADLLGFFGSHRLAYHKLAQGLVKG